MGAFAILSASSTPCFSLTQARRSRSDGRRHQIHARRRLWAQTTAGCATASMRERSVAAPLLHQLQNLACHPERHQPDFASWINIVVAGPGWTDRPGLAIPFSGVKCQATLSLRAGDVKSTNTGSIDGVICMGLPSRLLVRAARCAGRGRFANLVLVAPPSSVQCRADLGHPTNAGGQGSI